MTVTFERDLAFAEPYTAREWRQRPLAERFTEVVLRPIESQL
jgi:hypothetical protein